jgi:hypothetical protein
MMCRMPGPKSKSLIRPLLKIALSFIIASLLTIAGWAAWRYHGPVPAVDIFRGITYGCDRLPDTLESSGLVHWTQADLNVPGVSLFTTPIDPEADAQGFEYRLQYTSDFVARNHLAVAVNGTFFTSESGFIRRPGDLALSSETVVSDHAINHVDPNTYLLWWDDQNRGHMELHKPPPSEALSKAKWAIGGQMPMLSPQWMTDESHVDQRTAIGIDPLKKLVWIACFDHASYHFVAQWLRDQGATYGIAVDGGTSMAMVIGNQAKNVRPGTVTGNWRPVATHFGLKADPLP